MNLKKIGKLKTVIIIILLLITIAGIYQCANKCTNWCKPSPVPPPICSKDKAYVEEMAGKEQEPYFNDSTQEWCVYSPMAISIACYPPPFYCKFFR